RQRGGRAAGVQRGRAMDDVDRAARADGGGGGQAVEPDLGGPGGRRDERRRALRAGTTARAMNLPDDFGLSPVRTLAHVGSPRPATSHFAFWKGWAEAVFAPSPR